MLETMADERSKPLGLGEVFEAVKIIPQNKRRH